MYGAYYDDKFASMRAFLTYMMTMPGKKMTFMGTEFAQFREWDYQNQLEWFMLDYPRHAQMQDFVSEINNFYLENKQLWEIDNSWDGYEWINASEGDYNVTSYVRKAIDKSELIVVINFSPIKREMYQIDVNCEGRYKEVFSSDEQRFGGNGNLNKRILKTEKYLKQSGEEQNYIKINLPALSGVIFRKENGRARRV